MKRRKKEEKPHPWMEGRNPVHKEKGVVKRV